MATATCKLAVLNPPQYTIGSQEITYYFTLSFSNAGADTYLTGGVICDLTQAGNLAGTSTLPILVWVQSLSAQAATNQSFFQYVQGTTQANGKIQCFVGAAEKTTATAMTAGNNEQGQSIRIAATFTRR